MNPISPELSLETDAITAWHSKDTKDIISDYGLNLTFDDLFSVPFNKKISFYRCTSIEKSKFPYLHTYVPQEAKILNLKLLELEDQIEKYELLAVSEKEKANLVYDELVKIKHSYESNRGQNIRKYYEYLSFRLRRLRWFIIH